MSYGKGSPLTLGGKIRAQYLPYEGSGEPSPGDSTPAIRSNTITHFEFITHAAYNDPAFVPSPSTAYLVGPEVV